MRDARTTLFVIFVCLLLGACGGSEGAPEDPAEPEPTPSGVAVDCGDYEHQTELCEATCEYCEGPAPGNSCNECAAECADRVYCEQCGQCDE